MTDLSDECMTRHWCEAPHFPTALDQRWTCPECGKVNRAFDVAELPERLRGHAPAGTLGWTTRSAESG